MDADQISALVAPSLGGMGYSIVRVQFSGGRRPTLQIMAERVDDVPMTVEDCEKISRDVSAILDVADPIQGAYALEVSSPGIDRPLVRPTDFERFAGFEAKVELAHPVDGRKRFRGKVLGLADTTVKMLVEGTEIGFPASAIAKAKLVLTDELLADARRKQQGCETHDGRPRRPGQQCLCQE